MRYIAAKSFFVGPNRDNPTAPVISYEAGDPVPSFETWPPVVRIANLRCGNVQLETGNLTGPEAVEHVARVDASHPGERLGKAKGR